MFKWTNAMMFTVVQINLGQFQSKSVCVCVHVYMCERERFLHSLKLSHVSVLPHCPCMTVPHFRGATTYNNNKKKTLREPFLCFIYTTSFMC